MTEFGGPWSQAAASGGGASLETVYDTDFTAEASSGDIKGDATIVIAGDTWTITAASTYMDSLTLGGGSGLIPNHNTTVTNGLDWCLSIPIKDLAGLDFYDDGPEFPPIFIELKWKDPTTVANNRIITIIYTNRPIGTYLTGIGIYSFNATNQRKNMYYLDDGVLRGGYRANIFGTLANAQAFRFGGPCNTSYHGNAVDGVFPTWKSGAIGADENGDSTGSQHNINGASLWDGTEEFRISTAHTAGTGAFAPELQRLRISRYSGGTATVPE